MTGQGLMSLWSVHVNPHTIVPAAAALQNKRWLRVCQYRVTGGCILDCRQAVACNVYGKPHARISFTLLPKAHLGLRPYV